MVSNVIESGTDLRSMFRNAVADLLRSEKQKNAQQVRGLRAGMGMTSYEEGLAKSGRLKDRNVKLDEFQVWWDRHCSVSRPSGLVMLDSVVRVKKLSKEREEQILWFLPDDVDAGLEGKHQLVYEGKEVTFRILSDRSREFRALWELPAKATTTWDGQRYQVVEVQ